LKQGVRESEKGRRSEQREGEPCVSEGGCVEAFVQVTPHESRVILECILLNKQTLKILTLTKMVIRVTHES
jgi:cell shape-determining protein MreC